MTLNSMTISNCEEMKTFLFDAMNQYAILIWLTRVCNENSLPCSWGITYFSKWLSRCFTLGSFISADLLKLTCRLCFCCLISVVQVLNKIRFAFAVRLGNFRLTVSWVVMGELWGIRRGPPDSTLQSNQSLFIGSFYLPFFRARRFNSLARSASIRSPFWNKKPFRKS